MTSLIDPVFGALTDDGWFPSPAHIMRRAAILEMFEPYPGGKLLEMGCGAGRLLADWDRLGHHGLAVDLDSTARALATHCARDFDTRFEVAAAPGERDFDYLVAMEVLEHVDDPAGTLEEWLNHLKPGGLLVLTVPAFQRLWGKSDEWAGHVQRFDPDDLRQIVEEAGAQVLELRLYGYPIGNLLRRAGNLASRLRMGSRTAQQWSREAATRASGHDRSVERRMAPVLRSAPGRAVLRASIAMQRRVNRGHGLVLLARKPVSSAP